ncbi:PREDICTED: uncharacterized protein LOC109580616 [Amphimedon queenslandica]|uniref:EGF-like domain-containing protein n=1 Tax=Amphimedon queenslandica TaxID=400682 RepID=A0A1X7VWB4_AMPQE|nr:PREDICTED: uncharacterized protein LOC109580616 [Amphimedon queenslandica]|eukprot:XP_019849560.1 PREDICTED: uncharacterized protein LOC109580616 [Amphimedon queenslandica]
MSAPLLIELLYIIYVFITCKGEEDIKADSVLVMGGGSFIGYHISLRLVKTARVISLDSFTDRNLIVMQRAKLMNEKGVLVLDDTTNCESYLLEDLFSQYLINSVVYSSSDNSNICNNKYDASCISTEIKCLVRLLDILRRNKQVKFVYFSSVCVLDDTSNSFSPFTAIKSSAEDMVMSYINEFDVQGVMIRIGGSMYGPWSDPDSIVHSIATELYNNNTIKLSHWYSLVKIRFIHINKLTKLVDQMLNKNTLSHHKAVTLMNGDMLLLSNVVKLLKRHITGHSNFQNKVNITFSEVICGLMQQPQEDYDQSSIEEGLKDFLKWYEAYIKELKYEDPNSIRFVPDAAYAFNVKNRHLNKLGSKFRKRHKLIRKKYELDAEKHNIEVAKIPLKKKFIFFKGFDSGDTNRIIPGLSLKQMKNICSSVYECVAFTAEGHFKTIIQPDSQWKKINTSSTGLYVADIDVCAAGLHNCNENAICHYLGPAQFKCECSLGWKMHNKFCVPMIREGLLTPIEEYYRLIDIIEGRQDVTRNASFIEYKNLMSAVNPYNDIVVTDFNGDINVLKGACLKTYHCIGFSSTGVLKMEIEPSNKWTIVKNESLFVLDIDLCAVSDRCSKPQKCRKSAPGQYQCFLW